MNVLCIEPGYGSTWLDHAEYVNEVGEPDPDGAFVRGTGWTHEGGSLLPDGGINIPETLTYPRRWVLKVDEGAAR